MGSGGGGGSSGSVRWPTYFESWHEAYLTAANSIISATYTANPFTGTVAYDPSAAITAMEAGVDARATTLLALDPQTQWASNLSKAVSELNSHVFDNTTITAAETAFNNALDNEYAASDLPRFQRGMQDLNAVMSSAYVTGKALLDAKIVVKKAQYSAELRQQAYRDFVSAATQAAGPLGQYELGIYEVVNRILTLQVETRRYEIVANKEESDQNVKYDEADASWDIDNLTKGANILAAGQGGVTHPTARTASTLQSALGGAMSGAATGAMIGSMFPGIGTGVGAGVGALLGGGGGAASGGGK